MHQPVHLVPALPARCAIPRIYAPQHIRSTIPRIVVKLLFAPLRPRPWFLETRRQYGWVDVKIEALGVKKPLGVLPSLVDGQLGSRLVPLVVKYNIEALVHKSALQ